MNLFPTEAAFLELAQKGNLIPVYTDLMADFETPVSVFSKLRREKPAFILESVVGGEHVGRYSLTGCRPRKIFEAYDSVTRIIDATGDIQEFPTPEDPLALVEEEMSRYRLVGLPGMPPMLGGAVGFLGYEYVHCIERTVPRPSEDALGMPWMFFAIMDNIVVFDRVKQTLRLCANAHVDQDTDPREVYRRAVAELEYLYRLLEQETHLGPLPLLDPGEITLPPSNCTRERFEGMVDQAKESIRAGEVIQVVASQRFEQPYTRDSIDLYRALRVVNPSPYMFCLDTESYSIVGASPETHVRSTEGRVEIRPLAGTRRRGKTEAEDMALENDLLADPKERAEHLMLVDLARNDIGRVCEIGSVRVKDYALVERYSHIMHIVSQVEGQLAEGKNAYDLMRATFPAGTLTGAPKVRAMQIIAELEGEQRGVYAGALGYFTYQGNLDCCIVIRTALIRNGKIYIQSGAGFVADSSPEGEYEEVLNKAKGLLRAVALSEML